MPRNTEPVYFIICDNIPETQLLSPRPGGHRASEDTVDRRTPCICPRKSELRKSRVLVRSPPVIGSREAEVRAASDDTRLALRKRTATAWCGPLWEPLPPRHVPATSPGTLCRTPSTASRPASWPDGTMRCASSLERPASHRQDGLDTSKDRTNSSIGQQAGNRGQDLGRTALQVTIPAS